ncbi:MAG: hypothetical protein GX552_04465 [Chloroflexi bacterium]|nr:hypothetical protein [Chloroflexota bacterium]
MIAAYCRACGFWPGDRLVLSAGLIGGQDAVLLRSIGERFPGTRVLSLRYHCYGQGKELALALFTLACRALRIQPGRRVLDVPVPMIADSLRGEGESRAMPVLERALARLLERIGDRLVHCDVSFLDEFRARVRDWVLPQIDEFYGIAKAQGHLLGHVQPDLMIAPSGSHVHQSLATLCGQRGISALLIPMKALVPPGSNVEGMGIGQIGIELVTEDFPYVAAQSPLTAGYLEWSGYGGQRIETGPLIWSRLTDADREEQRQRFFERMGGPGAILVYAPSNKWMAPFHVAQTRDEVLSTAADLAEMVADWRNLYLVLRLHPAPSLTIADVETLVDLPRNAVVDTGNRVSFAGVLALADALVTDTSTAAEEAIQNGIPVLLYDRWARYNHLKAPAVTADHPDALSPAYYVTARETLASTLEWILENHPVGTDVPEGLKRRFVYAEGHREAFYQFVGQALGWMR